MIESYEQLRELTRLQAELIRDGRIVEALAVGEQWDLVAASLPEQPPVEALPLLEEATGRHRRERRCDRRLRRGRARARVPARPARSPGDRVVRAGLIRLNSVHARPINGLPQGRGDGRNHGRKLFGNGGTRPVGLFDTTQIALSEALAGASQRQQLLANNLANADTPGLQALGCELPGDARERARHRATTARSSSRSSSSRRRIPRAR